MGRSVTCNYHCTAYFSNGENWIFGSMNLKEVYQMGKSLANAYKTQLVNIHVIPQTKTGERVMHKDFLILDAWNNRNHYSYQDKIPFYTF